MKGLNAIYKFLARSFQWAAPPPQIERLTKDDLQEVKERLERIKMKVRSR